MCGIAGFFGRPAPAEELEGIAGRMAATLQHRGPDDTGAWSDPESGLGLGHQRLSIIDLSIQGRQPLHSVCGRYTIVYNGEIYNYPQLRDQLQREGESFRGHCDTEVLLAALARWGPVSAAERAIGMFALAVWDQKQRRLILMRDRLGIKPLYYGWQGQTFLFGSELKALRAHPDFQAEIDRDALALFLKFNYIPTPHSIYRGIYKLPAGTILSIDRDQTPKELKPEVFWSLESVARRGAAEPFSGDEQQAVEKLDGLLRDAVGIRLRADVELGAFLSGGVDSSTVVAIMKQVAARKVKTFAIGFEDERYNEAGYAKAVADHLGTEHHQWIVSPNDARKVIPQIPTLFDEPFGDSSQIPTFLVSQLARKHVKVSLSGDGGDELFGGYQRYREVVDKWQLLQRCPGPLRRAFSTALSCAAASLPGMVGRRSANLAEQLGAADPTDLYAKSICHWQHPEHVVIDAQVPATLALDFRGWQVRDDLLEQMMFVDTETYLPDDILVKVDRASMAVGLESRVPLLDHRIVEFAWSLPTSFKNRNRRSKWLLRGVLNQYVAPQLIDRPKVGFGVPLETWLRGPLRDWASALLESKRLNEEGYFRADLIERKWQQHLSGQADWHYLLWDVLMFQAWLETSGVSPSNR